MVIKIESTAIADILPFFLSLSLFLRVFVSQTHSYFYCHHSVILAHLQCQ